MSPRLAPLSLACLLAGAGALRAAEGDYTVTVNGIAHFNNRSLALLEITGPSPRTTVTRPILAAGERVGPVEVTLIDEANGLVRVSNDGIETTFNLGGETAQANRTFQFKDAALGQVLEILQQLTDSTVLAPDNLPAAKLSLSTGALSKDAARAALETALRSKGIETQERGGKYVFALQPENVAALSELRELPAPAAGDEMFPAGLIKFVAADLSQALEIYQELSGRTILRPSDLPFAKVTVRSQTAMARAEAVWMLDAMLLLNGIKMIPAGDKFVFALKAGPNAQPPAIAPEVAAMTSKDGPALAPGAFKWNDADRQALLEAYASLVGREPLLADRTTSARVSLRTQQALTPAEAGYALAALAALNNLQFVAEGDRHVKLMPTAEARRQSRLTAP